MFFALLGLSIISTVGKILVSRFICVHWYLWSITDVDPVQNFSYIDYAHDDQDLCLPLNAAGIVKDRIFKKMSKTNFPINLLCSKFPDSKLFIFS